MRRSRWPAMLTPRPRRRPPRPPSQTSPPRPKRQPATTPDVFDSLLNAFRAPGIRRPVLYVLGLLIVFRLLAAVPVPGIDKTQLADFVSGNALVGLLDL